MWEISNHTPFAASGYFASDRDGAGHWVVALAAQFAILPDGGLETAADQPAPLLAPVYADEMVRELLAEDDLVPFRPGIDILVTGSAIAPEAQPVSQFDTYLRLGPLRKSARIFGRRRLRYHCGRFSLSASEPVATLPLSWRHALGGADFLAPDAPPHAANPIGIGWTRAWDTLPDDIEFDLPCIEDPAAPVVPGQPFPPPHGYGPLMRNWLPRYQWAGTYDETWRKARAPLLPADFDNRFYHAAPQDQVLPLALSAEPLAVELGGFHAEGPLRFDVPCLDFEMNTWIGGAVSVQKLVLSSLRIAPNSRRLRLVYLAHVPCHGRDHLVEGSLITLKSIRSGQA